MEVWGLKMKPSWSVWRPVVADLHHFSESSIRILIKVKSWIRTRIRKRVMQISNPASFLTTKFQILEHYCAGARC